MVVFDDTLVVIEKSNQELEFKLGSGRSPQQSRVPLTRPRVDTIHNNRHLSQEVIYEMSDGDESDVNDLSRSSSQSTIKTGSGSSGVALQDTVAPSFPSLNDLTLGDTSFKSLTAQKLVAGLSFNSIDTLIEVNAVAEARSGQPKQFLMLNETTDTVDFGVI
jgi:hypothetical protein